MFAALPRPQAAAGPLARIQLTRLDLRAILLGYSGTRFCHVSFT
jgi:hypothetical protein